MSLLSAFVRTAARAPALIAAGLVLALSGPATAQGDLLIAPTRVVINGGGSSEVILNNIGATPATYRISLELRRMGEDGSLEDIAEDQASERERAALAMIRYAPRRVTLPPNQPQSIRISARPPAELPDGEYRVHMSFRAIPEAQTVETQPDSAQASGLTIRLTPIYGLTIPLIVRKGQLTVGATISNPAVERTAEGAFLTLDMARTGNRSIYGELRIMAPGVREPVFLTRGIAIYPERDTRSVRLPLSEEQAARLRGRLIVEYRETPENGGQLISATEANFN